MDLTPQVINEVEFSMARRGYDPDQVDEFLEKVAVAVGELHERVTELRERVVGAERRAEEAQRRAAASPERVVAPASPAVDPTAVSAAAEAELETLKRTLLLAQRTADAAVREAEDEARRIVAEAQTDARTAHETTRRQVLEEIASLEAVRDELRLDVDALEEHVDGQRARLQGAIDDLQRILTEPDRLRPLAAPVAPVAPVVEAPAPEPVVEEPPVEHAAEVEAEPVADAPVRQPVEDFVLADEGDDDAWARFSATDDLDVGPATEPVLRLDRIERGGDGGDDAYLSELRKAMLDDTGAPDVADLGFFDDRTDDRTARAPRFGRRR